MEKILLFSVVSDKDYKTMLYSITSSGLFDRIILAHLKNYRGAALSDMNSILKDYSKGHVEQYDTVKQALDRVLEMRSEETQVYITGSLYLVGEIKEYLKR